MVSFQSKNTKPNSHYVIKRQHIILRHRNEVQKHDFIGRETSTPFVLLPSRPFYVMTSPPKLQGPETCCFCKDTLSIEDEKVFKAYISVYSSVC